ncbi:GFA family protein [Vibrio kyushuensis]|uniref:GFA family protein n=1 Tax=Vibrio TaxID=662 RepID=UPI003D14889A
MVSKSSIHMADCSCGLVNLVCRGEPVRSAICHCFECQKRTGSVFGVQVRFLTDQVSYNGELTQYSRIADSGNQVTYHFCPRCSTTMLIKLSASPDSVVVPIGIFSDHEFPPPSFSIYEQRKHGWVKFDSQIEPLD